MDTFKFHFKEIDHEGQPVGMFSKKGTLTADRLTLDRISIPTVSIINADGHAHNAMVRWRDMTGDIDYRAFRVTSGGLKKVVHRINSACSHAKAGLRLQTLREAGQADLFRVWNCPKCSSAIDLCGREASPQVWCPYCDALFTQASVGPRDEANFGICDECGLYSCPKSFTILYIWFIVIAYGFKYETKRMCNVCMRKEAWMMLLVNFIFVVGVIPSLLQLIRAYFGGSNLSGTFHELDPANAAMQKGNTDLACHLYQRLLEKQPHQAGLHYNHGLAQLKAGNLDHASEAFGASLTSCINFEPAFIAQDRLLDTVGELKKLESTRQRFFGVDYVPNET